MFNNKMLINLYVLSLDKHFTIFIPVDEKVGNIIRQVNKSLSNSFLNENNNLLLNLYSGNIYKNNDIIRNTDIKNGVKLILI